MKIVSVNVTVNVGYAIHFGATAYALDGGRLAGAFPSSLSPIAALLASQSNEKSLAHPPTLERVPAKHAG